MLFYTSGDNTTGRELWKSDGTAAGTTMVKDIVPGPGSSYPSSNGFFSPLPTLDGSIYFGANDGAGREL